MIKNKKLFTILPILLSASALFGISEEAKTSLLNTMERNSEMIKVIDPSLYGVTKQWDDYFKQKVQESTNKTPVFFYFFTIGNGESMASHSFDYFNATAAKLKKKHPEIKFIGVLNGLPKDAGAMKKVMNRASKKGDALIAKVHIRLFPTLFSDLNIDQVPAYAYAECVGDFDGEEGCDFKFLAKGDIGLDGFVDLMAEKNPMYKGLSHETREAE